MKITALLLVLAGGWWLFAPRSLGGYDTYVVVSGPSMWPKLVSGDLVILRSSRRYISGEVAGYHTPQLKSPVVHQIVSIQHGSFTFKGVNNVYEDPSHPRTSEIVGRLWMDLGAGGRLLRLVQMPVIGGALTFSAMAYTCWPHKRRRHRYRRRIHAT